MQGKSLSEVHADPGLGPGLQPAAPPPAPAGTLARPEDRSQEFLAVSGEKESGSAGTLLVAGYLVMWALLLGFVFVGWRRSQVMAARLDSLEEALEKHDAEKAQD